MSVYEATCPCGERVRILVVGFFMAGKCKSCERVIPTPSKEEVISDAMNTFGVSEPEAVEVAERQWSTFNAELATFTRDNDDEATEAAPPL
jgi:hypothetical protein